MPAGALCVQPVPRPGPAAWREPRAQAGVHPSWLPGPCEPTAGVPALPVLQRLAQGVSASRSSSRTPLVSIATSRWDRQLGPELGLPPSNARRPRLGTAPGLHTRSIVNHRSAGMQRPALQGASVVRKPGMCALPSAPAGLRNSFVHGNAAAWTGLRHTTRPRQRRCGNLHAAEVPLGLAGSCCVLLVL